MRGNSVAKLFALGIVTRRAALWRRERSEYSPPRHPAEGSGSLSRGTPILSIDINLRSEKPASSWGGPRYAPYAFTEQGIYMLMTVLKGKRATAQSKALIRLFKQMKDYIVAENHQLIGTAGIPDSERAQAGGR